MLFSLWNVDVVFFLFFIFCFFLINILQLLKLRIFNFFELFFYFLEKMFYMFTLDNAFFYLFKTKARFQVIGVFFLDWIEYSFSFLFCFFLLLCCLAFLPFFISISLMPFSFNLCIFYYYWCFFFKNFCLLLFICFCIALQFIAKLNSFITFEFLGFFLCSFWGLYSLFLVLDIFSLYIFVEIQGVCFYILAALLNRSFRTLDAGFKYFIVGSLFSSFFLFGLFLIFVNTGLFSIFDLYLYCRFISFDLWFFFALLFLAITFLSKLLVVPFHFWSLDVYEGASYIVTFFFLVFSKVSFFYMIWLFFGVIFGTFFFYFKYLFLLSAVLAILYSTVLCFVQINIKRFFICSSYNHIGFILCALCCDTFVGLFSFIFYISVYMLMTFLLWLLLNVLFLCKRGGFIYLSDFSGMFTAHTFISIIFMIVLFSMAGLPPFLGFFAKFYVIYSLVDASFVLIGGLLLLFSVVSAYYYIRLIKFIFIEYKVCSGIMNKLAVKVAFLICLFSIILSTFIYYAEFLFFFIGLFGFYAF